MSAQLDSVTADAMKLRPEERAELERRVAELDAGLVKLIAAEEFFAEMRKIIDGR